MEYFGCTLDPGLIPLHISFRHSVELVSCILVFLIVFPVCTSYCMRSMRSILPNFHQLDQQECRMSEMHLLNTINLDMNKQKSDRKLPGHGTFSLHTCSWLESPSHFFPPYCGAGESHFRFLEHFPFLHVLLHALHSPHSPQFPSTVDKERFFLLKFSACIAANTKKKS